LLFSPLSTGVSPARFSPGAACPGSPRDPSEKQQMGYFLGAPFSIKTFFPDIFASPTPLRTSYFTNSKRPSSRPRWILRLLLIGAMLAHLNPGQTLRILFDRLSQNPRPYFYAGLEGAVTGFFDAVLDLQRDEQFLLGQFQKVDARTFYDVWTSHAVPGIPARPVPFRGVSYSIETSILPDNTLDATTSVRVRAETGGERALSFQLSRTLSVDSVSASAVSPLPFFRMKE